tara:strand:+ start:555 stop:1388 length:834 start_codon:yes stop_codon:yes gene_type:complete
MNYKEKITNELASHRDVLINNLQSMLFHKYRTKGNFKIPYYHVFDNNDEYGFREYHNNEWYDVVDKEDDLVTVKVRGYWSKEMEERETYNVHFNQTKLTSAQVFDLALEKATAKVDTMLSFYETRLHEKLDDTNEAQPITNLEIVSFGIEDIFYPVTRLKVEVQNGAKCELTTSIVWKTSQLCNAFFQMPTRFHNATDPKGRKVARPSFDAFAYAICDNKVAYSEIVRIRVANEKLDKEYARVQKRFQDKIDNWTAEMNKELDKVTAKRPVALDKCA